MSGKKFKSQASSSRAAPGQFGASSAFGSSLGSGFGSSASPLAYVSEPPDFSGISDSNVVVTFKNLSKRDSTTKEKALTDLQSYLTGLSETGQTVEDGVLEAWVRIYPRTSIDSSGPVRRLAHRVQGQISLACGKRIAKHLPKIVSAWLAGTFDNDRSVARIAQDALHSVFSTSEKVLGLKRAYQQPLLEYFRDAITKETTHTLSDERTTSPEDAEAKYARVIGTSLLGITSLLTDLPQEEIAKQQNLYEEVLGDKQIWSLSSHGDAFVRRSLYRLLKVTLTKQEDVLSQHLKTVSNEVLAKSLNISQVLSATEYLSALVTLTNKYPTVWTDHYSGKKGASQRLIQFLQRGSQGAPREHWNEIIKLLETIPAAVFGSDISDQVKLLSAFRTGVTTKDEPRMNLSTGWRAYLKFAGLLAGRLPPDQSLKIMEDMVLPYVRGYIRPSAGSTIWSLTGPSTGELAADFVKDTNLAPAIEKNWSQISDMVVEDLKVSLPEQASGFRKSQEQIYEEGRRWAALVGAMLQVQHSPTLRSILSASVVKLTQDATDLLRSRNGKPFGAAGIVEACLEHCGEILIADETGAETLKSLATEDVPNLVLSPSLPRLCSVLFLLHDQLYFPEAWNATISAVATIPDNGSKSTAFKEILSHSGRVSNFALAADHPDVQDFIVQQCDLALNETNDWDFIGRLYQHSEGVIAPGTSEKILSTLTSALTDTSIAQNALNGTRALARSNGALLRAYLARTDGSQLLPNVLRLTEYPEEAIAQLAIDTNLELQGVLAQGSDSTISYQSLLTVILTGLHEVSHTAVSVETLVDQAERLLPSFKDSPENAIKLLPDAEQWKNALTPFLDITPPVSLAITNPLGGATQLAKGSPQRQQASRDADGYSIPLRMAMYTVKLLKETDLMSRIDNESRASISKNIYFSLLLTDINLSIAGANDIWSVYNPENEAEMVEFSADAHKLLQQWFQTSRQIDTDGDFLKTVTDSFLDASGGLSATSFYSAIGYATIMSELIEIHGWQQEQISELEDGMRSLRKSKNTFALNALVAGNRVPLARAKYASRLCNELLADITGLKLDSSKEQEAVRQLILLNIFLEVEHMNKTIAKQRLIFFVQHVVQWLGDEGANNSIRAEVLKAMAVLLPIMKDIYGTHWGSLLDSILEIWARHKGNNAGELESKLPVLHASLKLYATLRVLKSDEDSNDDLVDAWNESEANATHGLIHLLKQSQDVPDDFHQPLRIVNELIARQISRTSTKHITDTSELFPLLYVASAPVQQTAFDILHKQIPAAQAQISVDAALDKKDARLPEELVSLILESPSMEALEGANFERSIPLPLRGYLYSWLLVFDHFHNASYKVKTDYTEHVKEGGYINGLLDFLFDFLGHTRSKPVDPSKFEITSYEPDSGEKPHRETERLLTHIWFLCCKHLSSLAKTWYLDCSVRAKRIAVRAWTEKYISPLVIADALTAVSDWAETQDASVDDALTIKVNQRAAEITASYVVDEQTMKIAIRLPEGFPLEQTLVVGINRVAVKEEKWQAWLRNTQGTIAFSNNNIIDGLVAFRKNVSGALKGQTECAICYSIISEDKQLPSKRCSTCKNLFHSGCLYRWFKSSNGSSCPLCRNPFNYG